MPCSVLFLAQTILGILLEQLYDIHYDYYYEPTVDFKHVLQDYKIQSFPPCNFTLIDIHGETDLFWLLSY